MHRGEAKYKSIAPIDDVQYCEQGLAKAIYVPIAENVGVPVCVTNCEPTPLFCRSTLPALQRLKRADNQHQLCEKSSHKRFPANCSRRGRLAFAMGIMVFARLAVSLLVLIGTEICESNSPLDWSAWREQPTNLNSATNSSSGIIFDTTFDTTFPAGVGSREGLRYLVTECAQRIKVSGFSCDQNDFQGRRRVPFMESGDLACGFQVRPSNVSSLKSRSHPTVYCIFSSVAKISILLILSRQPSRPSLHLSANAPRRSLAAKTIFEYYCKPTINRVNVTLLS